jgi:hypothetical protein
MLALIGFYRNGIYVGPRVIYDSPTTKHQLLSHVEKELAFLYPRGVPDDVTWIVAESEDIDYMFPSERPALP